MKQIEMQIGKGGVDSGVFTWLDNAFRTHMQIRIKVLKSAGHDKEKVKQIADKILNKLGKNYTCRIIGFTILLRKWRKARR